MAALTVTDASHSSHLVEEYVSMREAGELLDFVIKGSHESFSIHSLVLAPMSPVFKAMLNSSMGESVKREAEFPTIPDGIMRKIIDFAYTGTCTFARDELMPLITAAHYLQMAKLQRVCGEDVSAVLQPSNCFLWLRFAKELELGIIMLQVQKMMCKSYKEVVESDEFKDAEMSEIVEYLRSLGKKGIHSDIIIHSALQWIKHDSPKRSVHLTEVFACVSLGKCTKPFLSQMVEENAELLETQLHVYKLMLKEVLSADSAQLGEKLLVLGGQSYSRVSNNECWMLHDNELVKFADGPGDQLKPFHSVCQVPQGVMLTGGDGSDMCKLFDVTNKTWLDRANLLAIRSGHGSGYLSGKAFVIGGELINGVSRSVDCMDLENNIWQHGPDIPDTEIFPKVAVCNLRLYCLLSKKGTLYCLDVEGMSWKKKSNIPKGCYACSMAASNDRLFVSGGNTQTNCMYIPTTDTWCRLAGNSTREGHGALLYHGQKLLLIGGCNWNQNLTDVEEYDISSDTWSLATWRLPKPLILHGAFVYDSRKLK